ncbi:MAG: hypothetical protein NT062_05960 [Proteobacteria bacterium]|nr:hypothetical protein [Pseudomonadota bacterium]
MGYLDEAAFERAMTCSCGGTTFEVSTYIDRHQSLMLADANDEGRWAHDGEKFIDGIYRMVCTSCRTPTFESADCPRCHHAGGLADAIGQMSRLVAPKRCPSCSNTEISIVGFAPATCKASPGQPGKPTPVALYGEPGFHVIAVACDACDWAQVAEGCPLCGHAGKLRVRP